MMNTVADLYGNAPEVAGLILSLARQESAMTPTLPQDGTGTMFPGAKSPVGLAVVPPVIRSAPVKYSA